MMLKRVADYLKEQVNASVISLTHVKRELRSQIGHRTSSALHSELGLHIIVRNRSVVVHIMSTRGAQVCEVK